MYVAGVRHGVTACMQSDLHNAAEDGNTPLMQLAFRGLHARPLPLRCPESPRRS